MFYNKIFMINYDKYKFATKVIIVSIYLKIKPITPRF